MNDNEDVWQEFPDEVIAGYAYDGAARARLDAVFATQGDSPWMQAVAMIGLSPAGGTRMIAWRGGQPLINAGAMTRLVSGGAACMAADGAVTIDSSPGGLWNLARTQWRVARFVARRQSLPHTVAASLALGIALQALVLRLGTDAETMARWLADPGNAPRARRATLVQVQAIQLQRTAMAEVWRPFLPDRVADETSVGAVAESAVSGWQGMAVCAGVVTGRAYAWVPGCTDMEALRVQAQRDNAPLILVFRHARPDTVPFFAQADAVAFAQGGALAHACTMARAYGKPCVTAAGPPFYDFVAARPGLWLTLDGASGRLTPVSR
jgi:phosphohistidine swiveling domain-containing protein